MRRTIATAILVIASASGAFAQVSLVPFEGLAEDIKAAAKITTRADRKAEIADALQSNVRDLALYSLGSEVFMSLVEEGRIDKQVGTSAATNGSTTLVSKGSVPHLIGLAVESGALYQSVSSNIVTFRLNPSGLARALARGSYLVSGPPVNASALETGLSKVAASASFDLTEGSSEGTFTGEQSQLKEVSVHVDAINKRDPRHPSHAAAIQQLRVDMGGLVKVVQDYFDVLKQMPEFDQWRVDTAEVLLTVDVKDDARLKTALDAAGESFVTKFGDAPELQRLSKSLVEQLTSYRSVRDKVFERIAKSSILSFDYAYNRLTLPEAAPPLPDDVSLPTISTVRVIFASPLGRVGEATVNGALTWFNSQPVPEMDGAFRDFQISGSLDFKLPEIQQIGTMVLTVAGMGAFLHQQPFGIKVTIGDVETADGAIGVFQTKLTIPAGGRGAAQIPLSFTVANRSEFNTEHEIRGSVGLTFDLDKLFAR
jgi:hypothetical protein